MQATYRGNEVPSRNVSNCPGAATLVLATRDCSRTAYVNQRRSLVQSKQPDQAAAIHDTTIRPALPRRSGPGLMDTARHTVRFRGNGHSGRRRTGQDGSRCCCSCSSRCSCCGWRNATSPGCCSTSRRGARGRQAGRARVNTISPSIALHNARVSPCCACPSQLMTRERTSSSSILPRA